MRSSKPQLAEAPRLSSTEQNSSSWNIGALRSIWEQQQGRVNQRTEVISLALAALAGDRLADELRLRAQTAAHMLAGSMGMFGFPDASQKARKLEIRLPCATSPEAPELSALLSSLRDELQGPILLHTHAAAEDSHQELSQRS